MNKINNMDHYKMSQFSDEMLEALAEAKDIEKHPKKYKSYNSVED